jgi:hypothetical protein
MCLTPQISFATFAIEVALAFFVFFKNPRDKLNQIGAALLLFLGLYQLNEFFICTTSQLAFTRLAIATTSFLPAFGVTAALIMMREKLARFWYGLLYLPPVLFLLTFLFSGIYQTSAVCGRFFIRYPYTGFIGTLHGLYYLVYLVIATALFYIGARSAKHIHERKLLYLGMSAVLAFNITAFTFLLFLPQYLPEFPSVYCEFALLVALQFVIII